MYGGTASGALRTDVSNSVLEVDRRHCRRIGPPESSNHTIAGKPGVRLLHLVGHEQFSGVECAVLRDQVLIVGYARDPGSAGGEFVIQHQLARGEADTLGGAECAHEEDEFLVDHSMCSACGWGADGRETTAAPPSMPLMPSMVAPDIFLARLAWARAGRTVRSRSASKRTDVNEILSGLCHVVPAANTRARGTCTTCRIWRSNLFTLLSSLFCTELPAVFLS